jgi:hypothetical protein
MWHVHCVKIVDGIALDIPLHVDTNCKLEMRYMWNDYTPNTSVITLNIR